MAWWRKNNPRPTPKPRPTAEDFRPEAIRRHVFWQTVQHPATVFPGAAMMVAGFSQLLFGLSNTGVGTTLGLAFVGGSAWIFNWFIRGQRLAERRSNELKEQLEQAEEAQFEGIIVECANSRFDEGLKEGREILTAYNELIAFLEESNADGSNLNAIRWKVLAREDLKQAGALLQSALQIWKGLQRTGLKTLETELSQKQRRLAKLGETKQSERASLVQQIAQHEERVNHYKAQTAKLDDLLVKLDRLEGAFEKVRLDSLSIVQQVPVAPGRQASELSGLEQAVAAAKRVEQRIHRAGQADVVSDAEYGETSQNDRKG